METVLWEFVTQSFCQFLGVPAHPSRRYAERRCVKGYSHKTRTGFRKPEPQEYLNMKPTKNQSTYVDFVIEQLSPLGEITSRSMFGGHCFYCDGIVFALLARNSLYLKADDVNRPDFEKRGLGAFHPFDDQTMSMNYYAAPPEIFEDPDALKLWAGGAVEAGRRSKTAKKRPKKKA